MAVADSARCLDVVMEEFASAVTITGKKGNYQFSGPVVTVLHILAEHFGLCYRFIRSERRTYGQRLPNGSWSGILGQLQQQRVDFAGTLFALSSERYEVVDFSEYIYLDEMTAAYRRPGVVPNMAGFIQPYTFLVWVLVLMASLLVLAAILAVQISSLSQQKSRDSMHLDCGSVTHTKEDAPEDTSTQKEGWLEPLQKSGLWIWSAILAQSVPWEPLHGAARGVAGLWLLAAFTVASVYRSNLKAMLIIPKVNLPFDSLEELADSDIPTGVFKGSAIHQQILAADNSSSLGRLKDQLSLYYNDQGHLAVRDIYTGKIAFVVFYQAVLSTIHADFSRTGKCTIYTVSRGFLGPAILSLAFPKGSRLKSKLDEGIFILRESGIMNKILSDALINATECAKPVSSSLTSSKQRPLEMMDFFGVFSLYAVGLLLAGYVFLTEMTYGQGGRCFKSSWRETPDIEAEPSYS